MLSDTAEDAVSVDLRFLDLADMIPQMNPGGSGRIMRSEFHQMLQRMNFYMDDAEFDKLWRRWVSERERKKECVFVCVHNRVVINRNVKLVYP